MSYIYYSDKCEIAEMVAREISRALAQEFSKVNQKLDRQAEEIEELKQALVDPHGETAEKLRAEYGIGKPRHLKGFPKPQGKKQG